MDIETKKALLKLEILLNALLRLKQFEMREKYVKRLIKDGVSMEELSVKVDSYADTLIQESYGKSKKRVENV